MTIAIDATDLAAIAALIASLSSRWLSDAEMAGIVVLRRIVDEWNAKEKP